MTKKKSKSQEVVILIRIPDANARHSEGTLTIQRGDLGHITQFRYTGLTLRGNIAEAVQTALHALAKVEAAPPPSLSGETLPIGNPSPESEADDLRLSDDLDEDSEASAPEADDLPDTEALSSSSNRLPADPSGDETPSAKQQMSLF